MLIRGGQFRQLNIGYIYLEVQAHTGRSGTRRASTAQPISAAAASGTGWGLLWALRSLGKRPTEDVLGGNSLLQGS